MVTLASRGIPAIVPENNIMPSSYPWIQVASVSQSTARMAIIFLKGNVFILAARNCLIVQIRGDRMIDKRVANDSCEILHVPYIISSELNRGDERYNLRPLMQKLLIEKLLMQKLSKDHSISTPRHDTALSASGLCRFLGRKGRSCHPKASTAVSMQTQGLLATD